MANNYDRLFNQEQGNRLINALYAIESALGGGNISDYSVTDNNGSVISFLQVPPDTTDALTVGKGVTSVAYLFGQGDFDIWEMQPNFIPFNNDIVFEQPSSLTNIRGLFALANTYDREFEIPEGVNDCAKLFLYSGFKQDITIPEGVTNCSLMFAAIQGTTEREHFPYPQIPNSCINAELMFISDTVYTGTYNNGVEQIYRIPANVECCDEMFAGSTFNCPVEIENGITSLSCLFEYAQNFNQQVNIPDSVINCWGLFRFSGISQYSNIPDNAQNVYGMYTGCDNLTDLGDITINCQNARGVFFSASNISNGTVTFGDNVKDVTSAFMHSNFGGNVVLGNNVQDACAMFQNSTFGGTIVIPESVINMQNMFEESRNDLTICIDRNTAYDSTFASSFLRDKNNSFCTTIYCNNLGVLRHQSLTNTSLFFQEITNGLYNAMYNIYIYNNYTKEDGILN